MELSEKIARNLLEKGAVRINMNPPFTWTSGIKSPVYCDNRKMISFVEERKVVVEGFKEIIKEKGIEFDVIGGTATAAIPWAAFLSQELDVPMIYIRPKKKEHGAGKQIEGALEPGQKVLIVEDLISTGGSSVKAAHAVREEGECHVEDVLAIVTYGLDLSVKNFDEAALELNTLTTFDDIVHRLADMGEVSDEEIEMLMKFKEGPSEWAGKVGLE